MKGWPRHPVRVLEFLISVTFSDLKEGEAPCFSPVQFFHDFEIGEGHHVTNDRNRYCKELPNIYT